MEDFFSIDEMAESTFQGRVAQGKRELAVLLHKDITDGDLARAVGVSGPAMSDWMGGTLPKRENMKALAGVFLRAGLTRYNYIYLEHGDEGDTGFDSEPPSVPDPSPDGKEKEA